MASQLNKEGIVTAPVSETATGIVDPVVMENHKDDNSQAKDAGANVVKPEMPAKVFDFPKLPNEIKNMIFETAAHYNPAVVYGELKVSPGDYPKSVRFISGTHRERSEFRDLRNLAEAVPEFRNFLEKKMGKGFRLLARNPLYALRGKMDILVINFGPDCESVQWRAQGILAGFKERRHGIYEPRATNIGLLLAASALNGIRCEANCRHKKSIPLGPLCPVQLAKVVRNFSHLENVFLLVKIKPRDVPRLASSARASLDMVMKEKLCEARRKGLAVFDDTVRTWVEIPNTKAGKHNLPSIDGVFELLENARKLSLIRLLCIVKPCFPKEQVRFRVLVSSWYLR